MITAPIPGPLAEARFHERPNRFLIRARLADTNELVDAHLPDPGRLNELLVPGRSVWLRPASGAHRKTSWTAVLVETPGGDGLVSVDTTLPNRLIQRALEEGALTEELPGWKLERSEVSMGSSRFDFLLSREDGRELVMEVKSVTLVEDGRALFPDAVTARGARHVRELTELVESETYEAAVLFVLQRDDAGEIVAAREIDPDFAHALEEAGRAGVRILGRRCRVRKDRVVLGERVPARPG